MASRQIGQTGQDGLIRTKINNNPKEIPQQYIYAFIQEYFHTHILHSFTTAFTRSFTQQDDIATIWDPGDDLSPISPSPRVAASPLLIPSLLVSYRRPIPYFYRLTPSSGAPLAFQTHWRTPQCRTSLQPVFHSLVQYLGVRIIFEGARASHNNRK